MLNRDGKIQKVFSRFILLTYLSLAAFKPAYANDESFVDSSLAKLPTEVLVNILSSLDRGSLNQVEQVCWDLNNII